MAKSREINMNLPSADDLFTTQEERDQKNQEYVKNISVYDISDFLVIDHFKDFRDKFCKADISLNLTSAFSYLLS